MSRDLAIIAFVLAGMGLAYAIIHGLPTGWLMDAQIVIAVGSLVAVIWIAFAHALGGSRRVSRGGGR